jgi:hypothetical protein
MMHLGFTGSRNGMTEAQFDQFSNLIQACLSEGQCTFHHGWCIGCDCEAAEIAFELGCTIVAHPGYYDKNPSWRGTRGNFQHNHTIHEEKPFLVRDQDIVDASEILIATPASPTEIRRSGTWTTVRYGRKKGTMIIIINPDGSLVCD